MIKIKIDSFIPKESCITIREGMIIGGYGEILAIYENDLWEGVTTLHLKGGRVINFFDQHLSDSDYRNSNHRAAQKTLLETLTFREKIYD